MKKFIAKSDASTKILNIAHMASGLPVNVLISGEDGVGRTLLAKQVSPKAVKFEAKQLEQQLIKQTINLDEYQEIIVKNIHFVINKEEFLQYLTGKKVIATTHHILKDIEAQFAIKIEIPNLEERQEDLEELINIYCEEAKDTYNLEDIDMSKLEYDLSQNGISLKKSIFKNILLKSLTKEDVEKSLENYIQKELESGSEYKELLGIFEIPLLKAAKKQFKSQLQMANNLRINRITLRKKIDQYFKGDM